MDDRYSCGTFKFKEFVGHGKISYRTFEEEDG